MPPNQPQPRQTWRGLGAIWIAGDLWGQDRDRGGFVNPSALWRGIGYHGGGIWQQTNQPPQPRYLAPFGAFVAIDIRLPIAPNLAPFGPAIAFWEGLRFGPGADGLRFYAIIAIFKVYAPHLFRNEEQPKRGTSTLEGSNYRLIGLGLRGIARPSPGIVGQTSRLTPPCPPISPTIQPKPRHLALYAPPGCEPSARGVREHLSDAALFLLFSLLRFRIK